MTQAQISQAVLDMIEGTPLPLTGSDVVTRFNATREYGADPVAIITAVSALVTEGALTTEGAFLFAAE